MANSVDPDQTAVSMLSSAFLEHFIEYALLWGSGVLPTVWGQG